MVLVTEVFEYEAALAPHVMHEELILRTEWDAHSFLPRSIFA